jgi:transposase
MTCAWLSMMLLKRWIFRACTKKISTEGNPAYHPAMMLKIYFYAYARGIFSSRKIAQALKENIAFIFLAAWQKPDFRTISDFRKNNLKELDILFGQIVLLCQQLGMVKLGHIAIDDTKIKANASDALPASCSEVLKK